MLITCQSLCPSYTGMWPTSIPYSLCWEEKTQQKRSFHLLLPVLRRTPVFPVYHPVKFYSSYSFCRYPGHVIFPTAHLDCWWLLRTVHRTVAVKSAHKRHRDSFFDFQNKRIVKCAVLEKEKDDFTKKALTRMYKLVRFKPPEQLQLQILLWICLYYPHICGL